MMCLFVMPLCCCCFLFVNFFILLSAQEMVCNSDQICVAQLNKREITYEHCELVAFFFFLFFWLGGGGLTIRATSNDHVYNFPFVIGVCLNWKCLRGVGRVHQRRVKEGVLSSAANRCILILYLFSLSSIKLETLFLFLESLCLSFNTNYF